MIMILALLSLFTIGFLSTGSHAEEHVPRIYVYDDPRVNWSYLIPCYKEQHGGVAPWGDEESEHAQNMGEVWMHRLMMKHPRRTMNPEEASIFYIPMYITVSSDAEPLGGSLTCNGKTHMERVSEALEFLETESLYFKNLGGSDHVLACTWWRCGAAMGNKARVILSRAVIGINESPPINNIWARWECMNRVVTIPYVASSKLTTGQDHHKNVDRKIPFYFAGRARGRVERENLVVISDKYNESFIGVSDWDWTDNPDSYAEHITNSVFCLSPRGDTPSSRRLFDAVAAGCIPVMTESQIGDGAVPFRNLINYESFSIIVPDDTFLTKESVVSMATDLYNMDARKIEFKRRNLKYANKFLVYGNYTKTDVSSMDFNMGLVNYFLKEVWRIMKKGGQGVWGCDPSPWWEFPATWVDASVPPLHEHHEWVFDKETIVSREHSILMCTPPYTRSRPIRNFFKMVQDSSTWEAKNAGEDGIDLMRISGPEMFEIYSKVGWVKASMVRDPVTRLLSAFMLDSSVVGYPRNEGGFREFVWEMGTKEGFEVQHAFKPMRSMCGMRYVHFESIIQYENVNTLGKKFMKSLPGDIWRKSGLNWNGGEVDVIDHFDEAYESVYREINLNSLFSTCEWANYYNEYTLDLVGEIYKEDYDAFKFYNIQGWKEKLVACTDKWDYTV